MSPKHIAFAILYVFLMVMQIKLVHCCKVSDTLVLGIKLFFSLLNIHTVECIKTISCNLLVNCWMIVTNESYIISSVSWLVFKELLKQRSRTSPMVILHSDNLTDWLRNVVRELKYSLHKKLLDTWIQWCNVITLFTLFQGIS